MSAQGTQGTDVNEEFEVAASIWFRPRVIPEVLGKREHAQMLIEHLPFSAARKSRQTLNKSQQMRWSRNGADLLLQVRCAVYNGTLGAGFGHRFDRITNADPAFAQAA
jgi:hypothetical protein